MRTFLYLLSGIILFSIFGCHGSSKAQEDAGLDGSVIEDGGVLEDIGDGGTGEDMTNEDIADDITDDSSQQGDAEDPCQGVSPNGVCVGSSQISRCAVPTGQGTVELVTETCVSYKHCEIVSEIASCVLNEGACDPGETRCDTADTMKRCNSEATWETASCLSCKDTSAGVVCPGDFPSQIEYSGTITYQGRQPNETMTDWSQTTYQTNAQGILVMSVHKNGAEYIPVDAVITEEGGSFTVNAANPVGDDDAVIVYTMRPHKAGTEKTSYAFMLARPDVPDGPWGVSMPIPYQNSTPWSWSFPIKTYSNGSLFIGEANQSGVLRVFDYLRYAFDQTEFLTDKPGKTLVVWMRPNTTWSCGACFWSREAQAGPYDFQSQLYIPMDPDDQSYWSDAVTAHELGHWVMASYGVSPGEGGRHYVSCPTFPGQAWSEGWATFFSSLARGEAKYYDKQYGSFFWFDIENRQYSNHAWTRPTPAGGLLQKIDENEVAAMLWKLAEHPENPDETLGVNGIFLERLASPGMTTSPYGRGYNTHRWRTGGNCQTTDEYDTNWPAPMLADYLDAFRCGGEPAESIDRVTEPATNYPYPSSQPICPASNNCPGAPFVLKVQGPDKPVEGSEVDVFYTINPAPPAGILMNVSIQVPDGVRFQGKLHSQIKATGSPIKRSLHLIIDRIPKKDLMVEIDIRKEHAGLHAKAAYRFGRPKTILPHPKSGPIITMPGGRKVRVAVQM